MRRKAVVDARINASYVLGEDWGRGFRPTAKPVSGAGCFTEKGCVAMRAEDRQVLLFKVKDLMVTVLPDLDLPEADGSTVGSCTSEHDRHCKMSMDILELTPYGHIDPPYLHELRLVLDHALARSRVVVPGGIEVNELEDRMRPRKIEEIDMLERHLKRALDELSEQREQLSGFLKENPGWNDPEDGVVEGSV